MARRKKKNIDTILDIIAVAVIAAVVAFLLLIPGVAQIVANAALSIFPPSATKGLGEEDALVDTEIRVTVAANILARMLSAVILVLVGALVIMSGLLWLGVGIASVGAGMLGFFVWKDLDLLVSSFDSNTPITLIE